MSLLDDEILVSGSLARRYALGDQWNAFSRQISSANELIDSRNTVVHGSVTFERVDTRQLGQKPGP